MIWSLAQHIYGFEGSQAAKIFLAGFLLAVVLALAIARMPPTMWILMGLVMATTLGTPTNADRTGYLATWLFPVAWLRPEIQLTISVLLIVMLLMTARLNLAKLPPHAWFMLAIAFFAGLMQTVHTDAKQAAETIGFGMATIPATALTAGVLLNTQDGPLKLTRMFLYVGTLWAAACSVQFLINPEYLINLNGRFFGVLSNPQLAGLFIAPTLAVALWVALSDPDKKHKVLALGVIGMFALFAMWTGSRTTVAMTLIGWCFVLWSRLGKMVLFLPVAAVLVYALSFLANELQIGANVERLGSAENTRAGAWEMQLNAIAQNPWIGIGWEDTGATENSYLAGFAGYGIVMFLMLLVFMLFGMGLCARLMIRRRLLPPAERSLTDLVVGIHMMYFIGAGAEGFMLGRSSSIQTTLLIFGSMSMFLLQRASESELQVEQPHAEYGDLHGHHEGESGERHEYA
jgi:hypothetical protein